MLTSVDAEFYVGASASAQSCYEMKERESSNARRVEDRMEGELTDEFRKHTREIIKEEILVVCILLYPRSEFVIVDEGHAVRRIHQFRT